MPMAEAGSRNRGKMKLEMDNHWGERERIGATDATVITDAAKVASDELTA
jgi:hypothetical protein